MQPNPLLAQGEPDLVIDRAVQALNAQENRVAHVLEGRFQRVHFHLFNDFAHESARSLVVNGVNRDENFFLVKGVGNSLCYAVNVII